MHFLNVKQCVRQKYKRKKTDSAAGRLDDLLETKNYADLKKAAEDRSV